LTYLIPSSQQRRTVAPGHAKSHTTRPTELPTSLPASVTTPEFPPHLLFSNLIRRNHHNNHASPVTVILSSPSRPRQLAPISLTPTISHLKMLSRAATRALLRNTQTRAFQTSRAQLSSPYHYPEGPFSNLPFNTKTKYFAFRYWTFMTVGFSLPFGIAGALIFFFFTLYWTRMDWFI